MMFEIEKLECSDATFGGILLGSRKQTWSSICNSSTTSTIDRVWWTPGHLSISCNTGQDLITFDATPENDKDSEQLSELCLDIKDSPKKLVNLWHYQSQVIVLLYEDGELTCFNFDSNSFSWTVVGSIVISTRGATVQKACLHAGAIYWLESTEMNNEFNLCYRTLPKDGDEWNLLDFGRQTSLLKKCPKSDLYSISKGVVLWPRWEKGPAIYVLWNGADGILQVITPNTGVAHSEVMKGPAVDFTQLVLETIASWNEEAAIGNWNALKQSPRKELCFITSEGHVKHLTDKLEHSVVLEEFHKNYLDCMKYKGVIIAVYSSCARIWNLNDGKLLQVLYVSESLHGCWIGGSSVQMGGFFWEKGIYRLKNNKPQPSNVSAKSLTKSSSSDDSLNSLINQLSSQNSKVIDEKTVKKLAGFLENLDASVTHDFEPLVNQLQDLVLKNSQMSNNESQDSQSVHTLVSTLFQNDCSLPSSFICCCLEAVSRDHPGQLIQGIDLHLGDDHNCLTNEQKKSWDFLLNLSKPPLAVFKAICRLKYLKTPDELIGFVEKALRIKEKHFELFIYDNPSYIFNQIAKSLPPLSQSVDYKKAAIVLLQLLVKRFHLGDKKRNDNVGDRLALQDTLTLIGKEKDWNMAISVTEEIKSDSSVRNVYHHLFNALTEALQKAGVLSSYQDQILKLAPKKLGISSILDIVGKFSAKSSAKGLFANEHELTVKDLLDFIEENNG